MFSNKRNHVKNVQIFGKRDSKTDEIINKLTTLLIKKNITITDENPDLLIAIGGDGTFLRACRETNFNENIIYTGVNTGTLGFLQDTLPNEIFSLIEYISYEDSLSIQNVSIGHAKIFLNSGKIKNFNFLNEILIGGKDYSRIDFDEYVQDEFLQNLSSTAIIISTSTGQTAYSMNCNGPINLANLDLLTTTLIAPIRNSIESLNKFISNSIEGEKFTIVISPKNRNYITINVDYETLNKFKHNSIEKIEVTISEKKLKKLQIVNTNKIKTIRQKCIGNK